MNIFKKFYQKYIIGISYPIDDNANGDEQLKHLGIDESHPFFNVWADMLDKKLNVEHTFNKGECDYDYFLLACAHKKPFFDHYIITNINKHYDDTCTICWTYIENVENIK